MRLRRVKILSNFRGLPGGYEIVFNQINKDGKGIEPICFVGLNGSGKSNVLEVISEIFYYLENFNRSSKKDLSVFKTGFGFEIEYFMPKSTLAGNGFTWNELGNLTFVDIDEQQLIRIIKKKDELPDVKVLFNNKSQNVEDFYNFGLSKILPSRIIGYSSGFNELLSNPFLRLNFEYYSDIKNKTNDALDSKIEMNRFQFLDYNISKCITICNFIFDRDLSIEKEGVNLSVIKKELKLDGLSTFSINLLLKRSINSKSYLPSELSEAVESFKKIDPLFEEKVLSNKGSETLQLKFNFQLNDVTIKAFKSYFLTSDSLFKILYSFQILNIDKISKSLIKRVKETSAGSGENISDLIPKYELEKQLFYIGNITFNKKGTGDLIYYKQLSDGEHQLLQILGSILLMKRKDSLFLFDEPETHFNPEWRSKFIWLINECINEEEDDVREQEVVVTTHSPFMISDCKKENVFMFDKGRSNNPSTKTFGTSVDIINEEIFGKKATISALSLDEINRIKSQDLNTLEEIQQAKESARVLGESVEKVLLFRDLILREKEIINKND